MYRLVLEAVGGVLPLKGAGIIKPLSNGSIGHHHERSHLSTCLKIALCPVSCSEQIQSWRRCWRYFCHLNFPSFSSNIGFFGCCLWFYVDASGCEAQVLPKPASRNLLTRWLPRACETHERFNWLNYLLDLQLGAAQKQKQQQTETETCLDACWHVLTCLDMSWPPQEFVPFELLAQHWDRSLALTGAKALRDTWQTSKFLREGFFGTISSNS